MTGWLLRVKYWIRRRRFDRDLAEELETHRTLRQLQLERSGLSTGAAELASRRSLGNTTLALEESRDVWISRWRQTLARDLVHAVRVIKRNPSFALVAAACLALGIGANAAVFSVFSAVLLKPLPYRDPSRLVAVFKTSPQRNVERLTFGPAEFLDWHGRLTSLAGLAAYQPWAPTIGGIEQAERLVGIRGSGDLMSVLGVAASHGRVLLRDDAAARAKAVVISHSLWRRVFQSDPGLVGRSIQLDGEHYTVVGVMPESFQFPTRQVEIWTPLAFDPGRIDRGEVGTALVGRLSSGATVAQARAELATSIQAFRQQHGDAYAGWDAGVLPLRDWYIGASQRRILWLLIGAVAIVLLIACANVANLLLAWGSARREEIAVRLTLGCARSRIVSQLLTEGLLLGLAGAAIGLVLAVWARETFVRLLPPGSSFRLMPIDTDWRVVAYALGIALVSVLVSGLAPVRHALRVDLVPSHGGRIAPVRLRAWLLVAQTAATVLLLGGAGLLVLSFLNVWRIDPGFSRSGVLTTRLALPAAAPASRQSAFFSDVVGRLSSLPGIQAAGAVSNLPLGGDNSSNYISLDGRPELHAGGRHAGAERLSVTPDFFQALRVPLLDGRGFTASDTAAAPLVVVVNRTLATRFFPHESAVGKRIKRGTPQAPFPWMTIVGVAGDIKISSLLGDVGPTIFLPHTQTPVSTMTVVVHTDAPASAVAAEVRTAVREIDPSLAVGAVRAFDDIVFDSLASRTFPMLWILCFAVLAVMLSALGVHGVVSYALAQRRREFGIRLALGANPPRLLADALRQSLLPAGLGCAIGLLGAGALASALSKLVFGLGSLHYVWLFAASALFTLAVAAASSYPSARRIVSLSPTTVLRTD